MKTEDATSDALYERYYSSHQIVVRSVHWPDYGEMDVVAMTRAMFIHEFEIKTSRADFLAEMRNKADKHMRFFAGWGPNLMHFITPPTVEPHEVPGEIGLMHFQDGRVKVVKSAHKVHSNKASGEVMALLANRLTRRAYGTPQPVW